MKWCYSAISGVTPIDDMRRKPAHAAQFSCAASIRRALLAVLVVLAMGVPTASHAANASFQGLGFFSGYSNSVAWGVSGDGSVVVGCVASSVSYPGNCTNTYQAFRWTAAGGMVGLGFLPGGSTSYARNVNGDGSVVVGTSFDNTGGTQAFRWTAAGMVGLGYLSSYSGSDGGGVSSDGSVVVGESCTGVPVKCQATRWNWGSSTVGLGLSGYSNSQAIGVSGDGSVVVGCGNTNTGAYCTSNVAQAFRWTAAGGMVGLGYLSGDSNSFATRASGDGAVVVGVSCTSFPNCQAFRWTAAGMVGLGFLSGYTGSSLAVGVSSDGAVVVGESCTSSNACQAFRWTAADGMRSIKDLLTAAGVSTSGWTLSAANAVSKDGATIVGYGTDPSGKTQAWIAQLAPGALVVAPLIPLNFNGPVGGPFASDMSGQFTLTNTGSGSLNYSISLPSWLSVSPASSGSLAGGKSAGVMVSPGPSALSTSAGNYSSTITFTNTTNGSGNTSVITNLLVNQTPNGGLGANDNVRSSPPPDEVAGINRLSPALPLQTSPSPALQ